MKIYFIFYMTLLKKVSDKIETDKNVKLELEKEKN
jgi:hypothetical protein